MHNRRSGNPVRNRSGHASATAVNRRVFLKTAAMAGGLALQQTMTPQLLRAGQQFPPPAAVAAPTHSNTNSVLNQAEEQTLRYLDQIEQGLRMQLEKSDEPTSEQLRMLCIRLSMLPGVSHLASDTLELLGDSESARNRLSFLMPLVRWMSEPFLFPVETQGSPEEQKKEIAKIFKLMDTMRGHGFTTTWDNVGDASLSPQDAAAYREYYAALIRAFLASERTDELFMSLKLSALVHDLNAALGKGTKAEAKQREIVDALSQLLQLASQALEKNIFLRIDM